MAERWRPDTCKGGRCGIVYTIPLAFVRFDFKCAFHAARQAALGLTNQQTATRIFQSNRDKSYSIGEIEAWIEANRPGLVYSFRIVDGDDRIFISIPTLTNPQRNAVQSRVDTRVGTGKIVIE